MGTATVLVTGGAGYIGSHTVLALAAAGHDVVVVDDLSTGTRALVPPAIRFVAADMGDTAAMTALLRDTGCRAVLHFAGSVAVAESVTDPLAYYRNNTFKSRALIEACVRAGIGSFLFSSTAAIYGDADHQPIGEDTCPRPANPYAMSKLIAERLLADVARVHGIHTAVLRYFNVAGADPGGRAGQISRVPTHLIKIACEAATGKRDGVTIYGTDYDTPDGTCIRDYVHVSDLAEAHVAALAHLRSGGDNLVLNCGYGRGASVLEVLAGVERITGRPLHRHFGPRRPGDVAVLVANAERIGTVLGWRPRHDDLDAIITTALAWERRLTARSPCRCPEDHIRPSGG